MDDRSQLPYREESTRELAAQVLDQARWLVRAELRNTSHEVRRELKHVLTGGVLVGSGVCVGLGALTAFSVTFVRWLRGRPPGGAPLTGVALSGGAAALACAGLHAFPRHPFATPINHVRRDLALLRSRIS
jgi:hypothetical protein